MAPRTIRSIMRYSCLMNMLSVLLVIFCVCSCCGIYFYYDAFPYSGPKLVLDTAVLFSIMAYLYLVCVILNSGIRKCLQHLLKRKKLLFMKESVNLSTVISNLQSYVLHEDELITIEDQIKNFVNSIREIISETFGNRTVQIYLTGGTAERFSIPFSSKVITIRCDLSDGHALTSDFDFMIYLDKTKASHEPGEGDFTIDTRDCEMGYTRLAFNGYQRETAFKQNGDFLSARTVKNTIYEAILDSSILIASEFKSKTGKSCFYKQYTHARLRKAGPSIKIEFSNTNLCSDAPTLAGITRHFIADITFSIPCRDWPPISNWPSRTNRCWPRTEDIDRIVKLGCYLVPRCQDNDKEGTTWRFSFSSAEVELSKLITIEARTCFLALKIILKDFLRFTCSILKTYHLKTIFFNKLEKTGLEFWRSDNIEDAFLSLLQDLKLAFETKTCQHYWIPQINLFENISNRQLKALSKRLDEIIQDPSPYIQQCQKQLKLNIITEDSVLNTEVELGDGEAQYIIIRF